MAFKSRITKKVTWGDLDALGIVFYPRFYEWMDEASHIFFDKIGLNLVGLLNEKNIIFALVETGATYTKPARYHDEIEIISYIKDIEEKTLFMRHKIRSLKDNSILMEGYEKRICVKQLSKEDLKAIAIPEDLRQILGMHK
ncbi:MAG: acyl-CoA thioesterase [Deltaproteobacteria bacterium]|nr:MAG: acyl-CoA thioesterase [Deltaproteobacteria bacterium]